MPFTLLQKGIHLDRRDYYIYVLFDLNECCNITLNEINQSFIFKPYYIGKGTKNRINSHKNIKNTKHKKDAKTKSLIDKGYKYEDIATIIINGIDESTAYKLEANIIAYIGLDNLTNYTPGGVGGFGSYRGGTYSEIYGDERGGLISQKISSSNKGKKVSNETRELKSKKLIQKFKEDVLYRYKHSLGQKNKKMPDSFKIFQSNRLKGVDYESRYGKDKSKSIREKQSESAKGKQQTTEHKRNAARARARYLWCIDYKGVCYINLLRCEFIDIVGVCPFRVKDAIKVNK